MELVTAYQLSQVLQISPQAVRKRLDTVERERDPQGLVAWHRELLPQDWRSRLDLLCRVTLNDDPAIRRIFGDCEITAVERAKGITQEKSKTYRELVISPRDPGGA